jgi:pentapeptide repeat protein
MNTNGDCAKFKGKCLFSKTKLQKAKFYGAKCQEVVFNKVKFQHIVRFDMSEFDNARFFKTEFKDANFFAAIFQNAYFDNCMFNKAELNRTRFIGATYFSGSFNGISNFNYVLFEGKEKVIFDMENLSNVSFMNTDLTGVRFSDKARWGEGEKPKEKDRFKMVDERLLEEKIKDEDSHTEDFNLGSIKAVYRSLRENYEYRMRYDEAGQFFIREMELKRKYREVISKEVQNTLEIKQNNWFRRNLFSLTGWYYHLSRYGESLWRPTVAGIVILLLSTLFWLIQINPSAEPSFTNTVGFANATNISVWQRAFERSMADFLPLLPLGSGIQIGIIDFVIKIVGGAVTFGLILIALRRRFERRYRH